METVPPFPPPAYEDRKTGLVLFGIFTMLMGFVCALFVPLMLFGQSMAEKNGAPRNGASLLPAILLYGLQAVVLVWLGIGSMMARRWARALLLILSWAWLIIGVFSIAMMGFMMPRISELMKSNSQPGQPPVSPEMQSGVLMVIMVIMGAIFVIVPGVWVFFYQSKNVKATCEALDPKVRWTDRCPLPVLAASLFQACCVPMMLLMPMAYRSVVAVFGVFVTGPVGTAIYIVFAVFWGYCAWAFYKLDRRGWWVFTIFTVLFSVSGLITYTRHDVSELYALMGYPEAQIANLQKFVLFKGGNMVWFSLIGVAPVLGYLIYIRKFFPPSEGRRAD